MDLKSYSPFVFANLHEFDIVKSLMEKSSEKVESVIKEIGEIFTKHKVEEYLGLCLLHKHFNLYEEELFVRTFSDNTISIEPRIDFKEKVLPYMWSFAKQKKDSSLGLYPVEFLEKNDHTNPYEEVIKNVTSNNDFLDELSSALEKRKLENIFGLSLIPHNLFKLEKNETLMENDDHEKRSLYIKPTTRENIQNKDTLKTLWLFKQNRSTERDIHCLVHCGLHCVMHCGIHGDVNIGF